MLFYVEIFLVNVPKDKISSNDRKDAGQLISQALKNSDFNDNIGLPTPIINFQFLQNDYFDTVSSTQQILILIKELSNKTKLKYPDNLVGTIRKELGSLFQTSNAVEVHFTGFNKKINTYSYEVSR